MEYKLVRSARKTLTVCISDGEVIVKAPKKMTVAHIEGFLSDKADWIAKKLREQRAKADAFGPVINGECALYHGVMRKITLSGEYKRIAIGDGIMYVPQKYAGEQKTQRAIAAYYRRLAADELSHAASAMSELTGLKFKSFALTNARTKWGSCDGECNIRLNWRLVMLEPELTEYVIVHELAHTVHHDHSAAFWATVEKFYPARKAAQKRLKACSVLTSLYR